MGKRLWGHIVAALLTLLVAVAAVLALAGCQALPEWPWPFAIETPQGVQTPDWFDPEQPPPYDGTPSVQVNGNVPVFAEEDHARGAFEDYSPLDKLGRCGVAFTCLGRETMPTEPRGDIGGVRPTGWQLDKYDWVDGRFLYNRCHLVGWQLAAENDNERNLITGTRYFNVQGMLPYEDQVASYIRRTGNHVLYRVTPVFEGRNLVASGVLMEAESVEDAGVGVRFCVWCYNVEPGVSIDYRTGESEPDGTIDAAGAADPGAGDSGAAAVGQGAARGTAGESGTSATTSGEAQNVARSHIDVPEELRASVEDAAYVLNLNSHKFHRPDCPSVADMSPRNAFYFGGTREQAIELGYDPCGYCKP